MNILNDMKTAPRLRAKLIDISILPKIINICRQPRTFIKWHAGVTAVTGLILVTIIICIGMICYYSDPVAEKDDNKITLRNFGIATIINSYMLLICLVLIWVVPLLFLGRKYKLI